MGWNCFRKCHVWGTLQKLWRHTRNCYPRTVKHCCTGSEHAIKGSQKLSLESRRPFQNLLLVLFSTSLILLFCYITNHLTPRDKSLSVNCCWWARRKWEVNALTIVSIIALIFHSLNNLYGQFPLGNLFKYTRWLLSRPSKFCNAIIIADRYCDCYLFAKPQCYRILKDAIWQTSI